MLVKGALDDKPWPEPLMAYFTDALIHNPEGYGSMNYMDLLRTIIPMKQNKAHEKHEHISWDVSFYIYIYIKYWKIWCLFWGYYRTYFNFFPHTIQPYHLSMRARYEVFLAISKSDSFFTLSCLIQCHPWQQGLWDQHGAHTGPTGPRWAPCWPHEPCYLGCYGRLHYNRLCNVIILSFVNSKLKFVLRKHMGSLYALTNRWLMINIWISKPGYHWFSYDQHKATIWTNDGILWIAPRGKKFNKKKMGASKWIHKHCWLNCGRYLYTYIWINPMWAELLRGDTNFNSLGMSDAYICH